MISLPVMYSCSKKSKRINITFYVGILGMLLLNGFYSNPSFGQLPVVNTPHPYTFKPVPLNTNSVGNINSNSIINVPDRQLEQYEQDKRTLQQMNPVLYESLHSETMHYDLPSLSSIPSTDYYRKASDKLNRMLCGAEPLNLKQAVFTVENAYGEGQFDFQKYTREVKSLIAIAKCKAAQSGYSWNNSQTRNIMLFRVMADTLKVKMPLDEDYTTSYPMRYDFDDFLGKENWSKMFVSKLLATKSGQCHSLPLLYLILCEETSTGASLAFSPSHSYVKFKDKTGSWYNLEMTNGRIVSDAFILGSGFVTAEALKNHIYMEPLTKKQTIAQCLTDLAKGYVSKYGYDSFVQQCVDSTLKYDPTNIFARQVKADYQTMQFEYVVNQVGRPHPDSLKVHYPKVYQLLKERNRSYELIDASGYQEMPEEAYRSWLESVKREKEKQEHQGRMLRLTKTLR